MRIDKFKETIANYQELLDRPTDEDYVLLIAVEEVLKKKQLELQEKIRLFERYVSAILNSKCTIRFDWYGTVNIYCNDALFSKSDEPNKCYTSGLEKANWGWRNPQISNNDNGYNSKCRILENDKKVNDFLKYFNDWYIKYSFHTILGAMSNMGLYIDFDYYLNNYKIIISDSDNRNAKHNISGLFDVFPHVIDENSGKTNLSKEELEKIQKEEEKGIMNFCYFRDMLTNQRELDIKNEETKEIIDEVKLADIYSRIKVDISEFPKILQDEMLVFQANHLDAYYKLRINEHADSEKANLKLMQTQRIMQAYQKFKEATELLNSLKMEDVTLDRIYIDDLDTMFFKNGGKHNQYGYIEINEMFKNNTLLRMLDLSGLDFTDVDIRGMDFSGTNANIHPQLIYNKDMTNVNATGVEFSPFKPEDRFDDVILDGAIIDDYQAMIDLNTVKSYNNQTIISTSRLKK